MKLIFEKGERHITIDDRGLGLEGILTTEQSKTDYPFISFIKGGITKYLKTKWQKSVSGLVVYHSTQVITPSSLVYSTTIKLNPNKFIEGTLTFEIRPSSETRYLYLTVGSEEYRWEQIIDGTFIYNVDVKKLQITEGNLAITIRGNRVSIGNFSIREIKTKFTGIIEE